MRIVSIDASRSVEEVAPEVSTSIGISFGLPLADNVE